MSWPSVVAMRKPRLTSRIVEALGYVENDAYYALEERAGNDAELPTDGREWEGVEFIRALIRWHKSRPAPVKR